jgi:hypothetical protein
METWGEILNRQEREKEQLRTERTLAWDRIKAENPEQVPEPLMKRWRAAYGDQALAKLDAKHKAEYKEYFKTPEQAQTVEVTKAPQTLEQIQAEREQKRAAFKERAAELLKQNQEKEQTREPQPIEQVKDEQNPKRAMFQEQAAEMLKRNQEQSRDRQTDRSRD